MSERKPNIKAFLFVIGICSAAFLTVGYLIYYFSTPHILALSPSTGTPSNFLTVELEHPVYPTNTQALTARISNHYDTWVVFSHCRLEQQVDGLWYSLKFRPYETTANELLLEQNETDLFAAPLAQYGPRLQPGHYRLVYYIHSPAQGYATAEFDIAASI